MPKFRKKPVVIEAVQWHGANVTEIQHFAGDACLPIRDGEGRYTMAIKTLEGNMHASFNDWIIKGVNGEFYACKPDIFSKTYDFEEE